jgi:23S rRNA (uracil1939-C5)-methyltransferase
MTSVSSDESALPVATTLPPPRGDTAEATVDSLNYDGRGVARVDGKIVFIEGALPGETVVFRYHNKHKKHDTGSVLKILTASPDRVQPACTAFGVCGGCTLQHLRTSAQTQAKQQILREQLARIGKVEPERWLPPITGDDFGYRRRARLGVRLVPKKGGVLVGFRERRGSYIADLHDCLTLDRRVAALLLELRKLLGRLTCADRIPQIEVAVGADDVALVFRHLVPLTEGDLEFLKHFGREHDIQIHLQSGSARSVAVLWPQPAPPLTYRLDEMGIEMHFKPTDFVQIHDAVNQRMVAQVMALTDPKPEDAILDLFCGLGNFSLPLARRAGRVLGIDGDALLTAQAQDNAVHNGIANVDFHTQNLYDEAGLVGGWQGFNKWVLDPPRSGAMEIIKHMPATVPERIVYVSCHPATLARDGHDLVHLLGYRFRAVGVIDMFPQTSHLESVALFERG